MHLLLAGCFFGLAFIFFFTRSLGFMFRWQSLRGVAVFGLLVTLGALTTRQKDTRHNRQWFGHEYQVKDWLVVKINEPLVEKAKSYKADGIVQAVIHGKNIRPRTGKVLLYFSKDSISPPLGYGNIILISKKLQPIKNSGNPGAFNYERYAGFQQVFHNVFLKENDWILTSQYQVNPLRRFIFKARENILSILRSKLSSKDELGIAQALLIGYTNDLDKDLVQAYSNTGVVHIIAISGMHLGLIYVLLVWIFKRTPVIKRSRVVQVVLILGFLWLFSLLTGASASVLRAAVMFSFITIGASFEKRSSIYNSLAGSAFVMLCYNPFYLWDVGFQLSYLAVVGIVVFQRPVYNWFFVKQPWLDKIWKLAAISIAAQVLTFPVCIYYFHQFPNMFLLTNIIAVPLSSVILYTEIALVSFAGIPFVGVYLGKMVGLLVWAMNGIILWINQFPYTVWDRIAATVLSTCLLYVVIVSAAAWLMKKNKNALWLTLTGTAAFVLLQASLTWEVNRQQKLIVYNVPQHPAMDFIQGNEFFFLGDTILLQEGMLQNFHLKPGRIALQLNRPTAKLATLHCNGEFYQFGDTRILVVNRRLQFEPPARKINLDLIILSRNAKVNIEELAEVFKCNQYVFDASNSLWKIGKWQKECEELHLRSYSVPDSGAFIRSIE